jgi:hypothetical protein
MCPNCTYNIFNYGWHPNEAKLIKARAVLDYQNAIADEQQSRKNYWRTELAMALVVAALLLFTCIGISFIGADEHKPTIQAALDWTKAHLRDTNYDGIINCIDYAIVFYEYYPNARIIRSKNPEYMFDHLSNMVDGKYIEPQVSNGDPMRMWRKEWPDASKEDETLGWSWFATKKQW